MTTSDQKAEKSLMDRRTFFRAGGGVAASAAAAVLPAQEAAAAESKDERVKSRYRETEHVKNFYRVNRY